jgi:phospholipase C
LASLRQVCLQDVRRSKHVIYLIKENRTYDQVFGDLEKSGDGSKADGDPSLAIFGAGTQPLVQTKQDRT